MTQVVHVPSSPELLTASRLASKRRCSRLHHLRYTLGYRPVKTRETLRFGTLLHAALEAWWLAMKAGCPLNALATAFDAIASHKGVSDFERVKAQELMRGYHWRWLDEPYEVLAVEEQFRAPIVHPYTGETRKGWCFAGKLDAIVRDKRDGRVLLVEHKSSSENITPGSGYWLRLRLDGQLSVYEIGARSKFPIEGTIYDVIGKPDVRPLLKSAKPRYRRDGKLYANQRAEDESVEDFRERIVGEIVEKADGFYQRGEVHRLQQELDDAILDVWAELDLIEFEQRTGQFPRNPGSCQMYGSMCEFYGACTGTESLEDESIFYKSVVVHPELVSEEEVTPV